MHFAVGDYVCTTGCGLGCIIAIENIGGTDYYVVKNEFGIIRKATTLQDQSIREPEYPERIHAALRVLIQAPQPLPSMGHRQERNITNVLSRNNLREMIELLCQLYVPPDQERSSLRLEYYEKVLRIVASETAHVLELPRLGMRGLIEASIIARALMPELIEPHP